MELPNTSRRRLLKSTIASGALLGGAHSSVQAQSLSEKEDVNHVPVPNIAKGLRLVTFAPGLHQKPRIGTVLNDGQVIDIAAEAQGLKMK